MKCLLAPPDFTVLNTEKPGKSRARACRLPGSNHLMTEIPASDQLVASLLTCCLLTTAQVTIESVPFNVVEGENVLLLVDNLPENLLALAWYRGLRKIIVYTLNTKVSVMGPINSGRETVSSNGSLWIHNVTQKDTGFYTLRTVNRRGEIVSTTSTYLYVYSSLFICGRPFFPGKLTIETVPPSVAEGGSVLLLVHNLQDKLRGLSWYKGASVSRNFEIARQIIAKNSSVPGPAHSGRETVYSNGSLLLQNVTRNDTGFYTLRILSRHRKMKLAHVQLQVDTSLSLCCDPLTSAQLVIEPVPQHAAEGESILLRVLNLPEDFQIFSWYKGASTFHVFKIAEYSRARNSITKGPAQSRKETVYTNGSLLLQDVTEKDSGLYTLQTIDRNFKIEKAYVQIHVNKPVTQPFVRVTDTTVRVQSSVVFTCFSENIGTSIRWLFNNQSVQLTERITLSPSKCQLHINPVRKEDAGEYQCEIFNLVSSKTSLPVSLAVMNE
ncbi:pregnancy-specific glycoprotein 22-like isoform X3 [Mastomys coucha]|uniref:pregnancy-specific glycoprotein 22-like isoform X3 n=1 Tax=Mastomys coucha TaxID=35658 RepID=UPI0012613C5D|nr:pregnancy-specific glycoprotein 22-like isoform X3 [Mastomys coucha]